MREIKNKFDFIFSYRIGYRNITYILSVIKLENSSIESDEIFHLNNL